MPDPLTGQARTAPILRVLLQVAIAPRVSGLPGDRRLILRVREDDKWVRLGAFRTRENGTAILPAFRVESRGIYTLRIAVGDNRYRYLKVRGVAQR